MGEKHLSLDNRFKIGFVINTGFMFIEFLFGVLTGSLVLLADAAHNLTDSITLIISWLGNRFGKKPADTGHTFGHGRVMVITAFINGTILVAISALIFFEAYQRLIHPVEVRGGIIAVVAVIGIFANGAVAWLFRNARSDINVKAAFTNMFFDMVFSIATMFAGILIFLTHKNWIDPVISAGVGVGLLYAAFGIMKQATNIFLEGVPPDVDLEKVQNLIQDNPGVKAVKDLYAWSISSSEFVVCCSIEPTDRDYNNLVRLSRVLKLQLEKQGFQTVIIEVT